MGQQPPPGWGNPYGSGPQPDPGHQPGMPGPGGPPRWGGVRQVRTGGSILLGLAIGVVVIVGWAYGTISLSGSFRSFAGGVPYAILAYWVPVIYFVAAIVMSTRPQVARVGAGLFIAVGVVPLLAAGLCVGLLTGQIG